MSRFKNMYRMFSLLVALCVLPGCAATGGISQGHQTSPEMQNALKLVYQNPEFENQLRESGLISRFMEYWQAHQDRDWSKRFHMEKTQSPPITERFYKGYYAKAWTLEKVEVVNVEGVADKELSLTLTFLDPDNGKLHVVNLIDKWELSSGVWMHVISDPILVGFKVPEPSQ